MITLLTVLTASYYASSRREARVLATSVYSARARAAAEAAIWVAVRRELNSGQRARAARTNSIISIAGNPVAVSLVDAAGRINLNRAGDEVLDRLLASADVPADERRALVDAIQDWRDTDNAPRPRGAEDPAYADQGHGARDGPFMTVDELRQVRGMTDTVFRQIENQLTVYGDHARVNAEAASEEVLGVLTGGDESAVEAYLLAREGDDPEAALPRSGAAVGLAARGRGEVFRVSSTARAGPVEVSVEAVLGFSRRGPDAITVLEWH